MQKVPLIVFKNNWNLLLITVEMESVLAFLILS